MFECWASATSYALMCHAATHCPADVFCPFLTERDGACCNCRGAVWQAVRQVGARASDASPWHVARSCRVSKARAVIVLVRDLYIGLCRCGFE